MTFYLRNNSLICHIQTPCLNWAPRRCCPYFSKTPNKCTHDICVLAISLENSENLFTSSLELGNERWLRANIVGQPHTRCRLVNISRSRTMPIIVQRVCKKDGANKNPTTTRLLQRPCTRIKHTGNNDMPTPHTVPGLGETNGLSVFTLCNIYCANTRFTRTHSKSVVACLCCPKNCWPIKLFQPKWQRLIFQR